MLSIRPKLRGGLVSDKMITAEKFLAGSKLNILLGSHSTKQTILCSAYCMLLGILQKLHSVLLFIYFVMSWKNSQEILKEYASMLTAIVYV